MNEHNLVLDPKNIPLSLYVHIPWCVKKCDYCDFNSHTLPTHVPFAEYVKALLADAKSQVGFVQGRAIQSIFIGGGTPSLLPVHEYRVLFAGLRDIFEFVSDIEITIEANPGTLEHAPFDEYLSLGINRLSLGVQSFDNQALSRLGRVHGTDEAMNAICHAKSAGFERINVDLMHGLPMQTHQMARRDIETALSLGASHISWYQLTIEPNTAFYRSPPDLPSEDELEKIEHVGRECLIQAGFTNYEVSAWVGADDKPCRHNMNYWQFGDYLAIGAGGHGKITLLNHDEHADGVYRYAKSRLPKDYLSYDKTPKMVQFHRIAEEDLPFEFMMNALRLADGVSTTTFEERTGLLVSTIDNELLPLQHQGFMVFRPDILAPTKMGFRYVNHLVRAFL
ncbi:MAG: radical SAM family heme chaperone HemW [Moraxella sp.]|uniref:radical SAM family heme chaperone HemW n=1 Tax=Moraxella sp. TaxID=479 RepID=UPI0026DD2B1C|nr:radical SAM family heme chaperone HemW [Moraxella sp.]MDO4450363.1 radical SAM family heme chaperone HemW [Moraxella sp.]